MNDSFFLDTVALLKAKGLYREIHPASQLPSGRIEFDGKNCLNLSGNDYLGLSQHPALKEAARLAASRFGVGAGASRLITGNHRLYETLEEKAARFKGKEAALIFSSGYTANLGVLTALVEAGSPVFSDELNHASIIDGLKTARAQVYIYRHGDHRHLEQLIGESSREKRPVIVTDSVFSMDGDVAPLREIVEIKKRYGAFLVVDEAHATGVLGKGGRGAGEELQVEDSIDFSVGTFSKALGSYGAFVTGSRAAIDFLINRARSLIYTTALPPTVLAANQAALDMLIEGTAPIRKLQQNIKFVRDGLCSLGYRIPDTSSAIIPLMIGDNLKTTALSEALFEEGILAKAIRPPTVPEGSARIRITISAAHGRKDLKEALAAFVKCGRRLEIIADLHHQVSGKERRSENGNRYPGKADN